MSKFKSVLSDKEVAEIVSGLMWSSGDSLDFGKQVAEHIQQAVLAKLHEQEPVMHARTYNGEIDWDEACVTKENDGELLSALDYVDDVVALEHGYAVMPLYTHPIPCSCQAIPDNSNHIADVRKMVTPLAKRKIQSKIDEGEYRYLKGATVLVNEHGRAAIVNHGGAFYWVENADMYVEFHRAKTQFEPDHIPDVGKMIPEGWQLVPKEPTEEMADSAHDCESYFDVRSCYKAMLAAAPQYTGDNND